MAEKFHLGQRELSFRCSKVDVHISYSDLIRWAFEKLRWKKWDVYSSLEWNRLSGANKYMSFEWRQNEIMAIALGHLSQHDFVPADLKQRKTRRFSTLREVQSQVVYFPTLANRAKYRAGFKNRSCTAIKINSRIFKRAQKNTSCHWFLNFFFSLLIQLLKFAVTN